MTSPRQSLSAEQIEDRLARDGFPEMRWLWHYFRRQGTDLASLDEAALISARSQHLNALVGQPFALAAVGVVAVAVAFLVIRKYLGLPGVTLLDMTMQLLLAGLGVYVLLFALTVIIRSWVYPWKKIAATDLARMLYQPDYRAWLINTDRGRRFQEDLAKLKIARWDDPSYCVCYTSEGGSIRTVDVPPPATLIQQALREVLGAKVDRKFQPGRFHDHLRDGKKSVSRFVAAHQEELATSRNAGLSAEAGAVLLSQLRGELLPDSAGDRFLADTIQTLQHPSALPKGVVRAYVWPRDPWVDLTHSRDFFSSASLRGNSLLDHLERRSKGMLGPFGYLRNPSISALDFRTAAGRGVRARLALVHVDSAGRSAGTALFVDAVEGRVTVKTELIRQAIEDYAAALGVDWVIYYKFPLNRVPLRFVRHLEAAGCRPVEVRLQYVDASTREYLDAFGLPLEPFEYAYPAGRVIGYPVLIAGPSLPPHRPAGKARLLWCALKDKSILWALVGISFLNLLWVVHSLFPQWLIPAAVLVVLILLYERLLAPRLRRRIDDTQE